MLEFFKYITSGFWVWLGSFLIIAIILYYGGIADLLEYRKSKNTNKSKSISVYTTSNKGKHELLTPHEYEPNDPLDPKNIDVAKILEEERKRML